MNKIRYNAANLISRSEKLPKELKALLNHYSTGEMRLREGKNAVKIQKHVEDRKDEFTDELFSVVEEELEEENNIENVDFGYDTKLTFPADLTLGFVYENAGRKLPENYEVLNRNISENFSNVIANHFTSKNRLIRQKNRVEHNNAEILETVSRAENFTNLVNGLLIEGDMRDAIFDEEYEDFQTHPPLNNSQVAKTAQESLNNFLQPRLRQENSEVIEAYEQAVDLSMGHQEEDEDFRNLFEQALASPNNAEEITSPYRDSETESRFSINWSNQELPFFSSQYERVGVLYDGMFDMYQEAGIPIDDNFRKSLVLSTIGAQIWLDDVDDLEEDWRNGQLTPVTAELLVSNNVEEAYKNIVSIKNQYLDEAREYAVKSDSNLASIGIEYIDERGKGYNLAEEIENLRF